MSSPFSLGSIALAGLLAVSAAGLRAESYLYGIVRINDHSEGSGNREWELKLFDRKGCEGTTLTHFKEYPFWKDPPSRSNKGNLSLSSFFTPIKDAKGSLMVRPAGTGRESAKTLSNRDDSYAMKANQDYLVEFPKGYMTGARSFNRILEVRSAWASGVLFEVESQATGTTLTMGKVAQADYFIEVDKLVPGRTSNYKWTCDGKLSTSEKTAAGTEPYLILGQRVIP